MATMEKYYLKNWKTYPFKEKSFEGQLDRFAIACVTSLKAPNLILDIVPVWGRDYSSGMGRFIKLIHEKELGNKLDRDSLEFMSYFSKPIDGEFIEIKSKHGPLFKIRTRNEAEYGLCNIDEINKPIRDTEGGVIIYNTMKVFTWSRYDSEFLQYNYVKGWFPEDMYSKYFCYRYFPISMLNDFESHSFC